MSNETILRSFPENKEEALTMLYLQQQDLSDKSPEDIVELYYSAFNAIKSKSIEIRNKNRKPMY